MRQRLGLGAFFLLCFCVALMLNMPVSHVLGQIEMPDNIAISGVKGTLFDGNINRLVVNRVQVDDLNYSFRAECLLGLEVCYDLAADQGQGRVIAGPIDQSIELDGFEINYPLENLAAFADKMLIRPSGELQVFINHLNMRQQKLSQLDARVIWKQGGIVGEPIELGDYELRITPTSQGYQFALKDLDALLTVDGKGQLKANGQYTANINIQTQPGLNQSIKSALEFVAKKNGLNRYDIRRNGNLPNQVLNHLSF